MAHDVFISHSSRDKTTADAVCHALEADGIRCWIAPRDIRPGLSWKQSVVEAIREAPVMVLIFSGEANSSAQVQREVDIAFESGNPILPFRIEDVEMNEDLYYCVADRHWLDALTDPKDEHIGKLVSSVQALLGTGRAEDSASAKPEPASPAETPPIAVAAPVSKVELETTAPSSPPKSRAARGGIGSVFGKRARLGLLIAVAAVALVFVGRSMISGESVSELTRQGVEAYDAEDYSTALPFLIRAAERDDPEAQYTLGRMYFNGYGVVQDVDRAHALFQESAEQNHPGGQSAIGFLYSTGQIYDRDDEEAVRWYRMAADQGFAQAQFNMGYMVQNGRGVEASDEDAVQWYRLAADGGFAAAQTNLGYMYYSGLGVDIDLEEAVRLYRLAAEQSDIQGQLNLAILYGQGKGVERNYGEQVKWYGLAAAQGDSTAQASLTTLRNRSWATAPLLPGAWTTLQVEERSSELERFAADPVAARLEGWDLERLRTLPITFYTDAALYEVEVWRDDERGVFTYLRAGDRITAIDGNSAGVHALNAESLLQIGSIRQAVSYLRFFVGALEGSDLRFQVVDEIEDLLWLPDATDADRQAVAGKLRLLDISEGPDGSWQGTGTVVYGQGAYDVDLELSGDGKVEMLNDTLIAADLPLYVESFNDVGIRTRTGDDSE
jgi:TPR repeat protein